MKLPPGKITIDILKEVVFKKGTPRKELYCHCCIDAPY